MFATCELKIRFGINASEVVGVIRTPSFHDNNHEKDEEVRSKKIPLLDSYYRVKHFGNAFKFKLNFHNFV